MVSDTSMGGRAAAFPSTCWSRIRQGVDHARPADRERLEHLISQYWKPVYRYVRARWGRTSEDAKDLTQGFFTMMVDGNYFERLTPEFGSFRAYLKVALNHFVTGDGRRARALKRGGGNRLLPLDVLEIEPSSPGGGTPEEIFDREWITTCLSAAIRKLEDSLRAKKRAVYFRVFEAYYLREGSAATPPSYDTIAKEFGLKAYDVSNYLMYARKKLRLLLLESAREYTSSESDLKEELAFLLRDGL